MKAEITIVLESSTVHFDKETVTNIETDIVTLLQGKYGDVQIEIDVKQSSQSIIISNSNVGSINQQW